MKYTFLFISSILAVFTFDRFLNEVEHWYNIGEFETVADTLQFATDSLDHEEVELFIDIAHALYHDSLSWGESDRYYDTIPDTLSGLKSIALLQQGNIFAYNDLNVRGTTLQELFSDKKKKEKLERTVDYYKESLKSDWTNIEARYNYELMKRMLDFIENNEQPPQDQQNQDQENQDQENQDQENQDQQDQDQEGQDQDQQGENGEDQKDQEGDKSEEGQEGDDQKDGQGEDNQQGQDGKEEGDQGKEGDQSSEKKGDQQQQGEQGDPENKENGEQAGEQKSGEQKDGSAQSFEQGQLSEKEKEELKQQQIRANLQKMNMTPEEAEKLFQQYQGIQEEYYNQKKKPKSFPQNNNGGNDW